jgi:uracil-DNA glycosylase
MKPQINIAPSWRSALKDELSTPYMVKLLNYVEKERSKKTIYPPESEVYSAFNFTPLKKTKVVIIGQDPYHGEDQAHGLCFSVKPGVKVPPSLRNIYKELKRDLNLTTPTHGNLCSWAKQGVLLLNSVLTVEDGKPASHQKIGWEKFTDKVVEVVNSERENVVFMLWGNYAKKKGINIDRKKHLVLESGHPSPLSARFFTGNSHFSKANKYFKKTHQTPIDWSLS